LSTASTEIGVHLPEQVAAESRVEVDAERRGQAVIDCLLVGEALIVEAEQRIRARIDGDVYARVRKQLPRPLRYPGAMVEDIVRAQHAGFGELRTQLGEVADKFGQNMHVEATSDLPPVELELAEQADPNQAVATVPAPGKTPQIRRQMGR
jgi:hypothetical protein